MGSINNVTPESDSFEESDQLRAALTAAGWRFAHHSSRTEGNAGFPGDDVLVYEVTASPPAGDAEYVGESDHGFASATKAALWESGQLMRPELTGLPDLTPELRRRLWALTSRESAPWTLVLPTIIRPHHPTHVEVRLTRSGKSDAVGDLADQCTATAQACARAESRDAGANE